MQKPDREGGCSQADLMHPPSRSGFCQLPRAVLYPLFNLRQARQHHVTDNLQTLRRNLIERVFLCVPVRISAELNDVERIDARAQERFMIVTADTFTRIDKDRLATNLFRVLPDNIL